MACKKWKNSINEYIDDLLPKDKRIAFEAHMADCSDCCREVNEFWEVVAMVKTLSQKDLPDNFEIKLRSAIETDELRKIAIARKRINFSGTIKWAGAAAAILLILFGVLTDRIDLNISGARHQDDQQRILMEAAPAQEEATLEQPQADANLAIPTPLPSPVPPKPAAENTIIKKDTAQEARIYTADIPGIKTNAIDLKVDSVQVTTETLRNIAIRHGIEILDLSRQSITLRVEDRHREILYRELSRLGRIVETGDQTGGDVVLIMILYGFE